MWPRSRDLLFKFWDPHNISGTAEVTNLKFGMQIDLGILNQKNEKLVKLGCNLGHVTYFPNFGTSIISLERLKILTSNFAHRSTSRYTKPRNEKLVKRGLGLGHVTYFSNFGTPNIWNR